jgi:hypothetical protein
MRGLRSITRRKKYHSGPCRYLSFVAICREFGSSDIGDPEQATGRIEAKEGMIKKMNAARNADLAMETCYFIAILDYDGRRAFGEPLRSTNPESLRQQPL